TLPRTATVFPACRVGSTVTRTPFSFPGSRYGTVASSVLATNPANSQGTLPPRGEPRGFGRAESPNLARTGNDDKAMRGYRYSLRRGLSESRKESSSGARDGIVDIDQGKPPALGRACRS